jgi:hypothetical protein
VFDSSSGLFSKSSLLSKKNENFLKISETLGQRRPTQMRPRAAFSENFNDFVDFLGRFLEKVEGPQKKASRAAGWPTLL